MKNKINSKNAVSPREFARRNGLGLTKTYEEIKSGRLIARKCGTRTLITLDDERSWVQSLPKLSPRSSEASKGTAEHRGSATDKLSDYYVDDELKQLIVDFERENPDLFR